MEVEEKIAEKEGYLELGINAYMVIPS